MGITHLIMKIFKTLLYILFQSDSAICINSLLLSDSFHASHISDPVLSILYVLPHFIFKVFILTLRKSGSREVKWHLARVVEVDLNQCHSVSRNQVILTMIYLNCSFLEESKNASNKHFFFFFFFRKYILCVWVPHSK